ncbi:hypothetical protein GQR58_013916 [Nymphon striatum]|nr:hypothetical protein GQR58_013916 [Nymphon striatum]
MGVEASFARKVAKERNHAILFFGRSAHFFENSREPASTVEHYPTPSEEDQMQLPHEGRVPKTIYPLCYSAFTDLLGNSSCDLTDLKLNNHIHTHVSQQRMFISFSDNLLKKFVDFNTNRIDYSKYKGIMDPPILFTSGG